MMEIISCLQASWGLFIEFRYQNMDSGSPGSVRFVLLTPCPERTQHSSSILAPSDFLECMSVYAEQNSILQFLLFYLMKFQVQFKSHLPRTFPYPMLFLICSQIYSYNEPQGVLTGVFLPLLSDWCHQMGNSDSSDPVENVLCCS